MSGPGLPPFPNNTHQATGLMYPVYGSPQIVTGPVSPVRLPSPSPRPFGSMGVASPFSPPVSPTNKQQTTNNSNNTHDIDPNKKYKAMLAKSESLSNENIIPIGEDPFAPEALDALFEVPVKKDKERAQKPPRERVLVPEAISTSPAPMPGIFYLHIISFLVSVLYFVFSSLFVGISCSEFIFVCNRKSTYDGSVCSFSLGNKVSSPPQQHDHHNNNKPPNLPPSPMMIPGYGSPQSIGKHQPHHPQQSNRTYY
jgi:hypothetical protein